MIRVTVELLPHGDASRARHLGTMTIANDGTGTLQRGNYTATLSKWGQPNAVWKHGRVVNFDRKRRGAWDLMLQVLRSAVGDRNR